MNRLLVDARYLIVALVFFGVLALVGGEVAKQQKLHSAAHAGLLWLLSYDKPYGNAAVLWALTDINRRYCHSADFSNQLQKHFELFPGTPAERAYAAYLNNSAVQALSEKILERYDTWLLSSLACAKTPMPEDIEKEILSTDTATGYDLTHKFLALVYIRSLGCTISAGEKERDAAEKTAEQKILAEEEASTRFSDLSSERAALLLRGGYGASVSNNWITYIAKAQNKDGGWGSARMMPSNPHTTALSLWAIAQKTGRCPL